MKTSRQYFSLEQHVKHAEEIAAANNGFLPRFTRLMQLHQALAQATLRKPELFAHIAREPNVNLKLEEHVRTAEELAAANNGKLLSYTDLMAENPRLAGVIRDKPEAFAHLPRAKTFTQQKLTRQRVAEAEALAAANGGVLEITLQFQREHMNLVLHIRRHPEAFAHIARKRRRVSSIADHICEAERMAEENGGKLQCSSALRRVAPTLDEAIRKHRSQFVHIPREGRLRSPRGEFGPYVTQAEQIAEKHGGVLPNAGKLRLINNNLVSTIYRHPELFSHIPQEIRDGAGRLVSIRNPKTETPTPGGAI